MQIALRQSAWPPVRTHLHKQALQVGVLVLPDGVQAMGCRCLLQHALEHQELVAASAGAVLMPLHHSVHNLKHHPCPKWRGLALVSQVNNNTAARCVC